ncbi:MAG: AarF/UbiB family protein [Actinobacteria bacterium]|nr:AarF/UbiB family protein [Actinomycetota bacterium]
MSEPARRAPDTFSSTGVISGFRGPYRNGPPEDALAVEIPPIDHFGWPELRRMAAIVAIALNALAKAIPRKLFTHRKTRWAVVISNAAVDGFEKLGPTFVKLGQLIASSPGLFPPALADACQRCLDEVPPFDAAEVHRMIREDLGRSPAQLFCSFDDYPLSAASVAQVHACVLPDGRDAVVKLQRPNISAEMNTDLRILHKLALALARTKAGMRFNAPAVIEDLHQVTNQELNFALEAHRQSCFRENIGVFGDNKWVTAPEVYWDYCGPRTICMERMVGVPMDAFDIIRDRDIDAELVLRRGCKVWLEAALVHGPFHGDMHAGNVWLLDDGRTSFLDFGIMGELDEQWRKFLCDVLYTILFDRHYLRIARAFRHMEIFPSQMEMSDEVVASQLKMVLDPLLDQSVSALDLGEIIAHAYEIAESLGAIAPKEMVLITKQLLYLERYTKELVPDYMMVRDPFLVINIFPEAASAKADELGITLPD